MTRYLHKRSVQLGLGLGAVLIVAAALTTFVLSRQSRPSRPNFNNADVNAVQGLVQHSPAGFMGVVLPIRTPAPTGNALPAGFQFHPDTCQPDKVSTPSDTVASGVQLTSTSTSIRVVAAKTPDYAPVANLTRRADCSTMTITGPDGASGIVGVSSTPPIEGVESIYGSHLVLQDQTGTFDEYTYNAQITPHLIVTVIAFPNQSKLPRSLHIDPRPAQAALKTAVGLLANSH